MQVNELSSEHKQERPQFSLRSLLLMLSGATVYVLVAMAMIRHQGRLLDFVTDWAGILALGCGLCAVASIAMMAASASSGRYGYRWPIVVLCVALVYAPANIITFIATLSVDRFTIFEDVYFVLAILVGPALMLVAVVIFAGFVRPLGWLSFLGYTIWIEMVALAHLWIIAAAAASV